MVSDAAADAGGVQRVPRVVDVANASTPEFVPSQGQGQGLPKTDAMYSAGRTKFREFIKSRPVEDRIEAYWFNFLDGDGKIRDGTFRMFAEWLDEQPKMSESAFKTAALKWTQHNLVLQHRARYLPTSHLGAYVTTLPGVATIWEKYKVGRASQVRVEFVDLQQQTESATSRLAFRPTPGASTRGEPTRSADAGPSTSCLLYTSPSPRDQRGSRMPSSA